MDQQRKWLKGDTHLHTTNSDGVLTPEQMIAALKKKGLDWAILTEHNYHAADTPYYEGALLMIQGEEVTSRPGHFNVWGIKMPVETPYTLDSYEDFVHLMNVAKNAGGTVSVNHPFCKKCGWHLPLEGFPMDCVEVWNAPMHIDDMTNIRWWHNQLLKGRRISAVGGSDYHRDHKVTDLLAMPTTFVYAKSNTQEDVLEALRNGNSFITQGPHKTRLYLSCGEAYAGETVQWNKEILVHLKVEKMKKGHRLVVYNNDNVVLDQKAKKAGTLETDIAVAEKGFVRAEVLYEFKHISKIIYKKIIKKIMPKDVGIPIPPFAYCLTNPIYFE